MLILRLFLVLFVAYQMRNRYGSRAAIYDVSIAYRATGLKTRPYSPSMLIFMGGTHPRIDLRIQRIPLDDIPLNSEEVSTTPLPAIYFFPVTVVSVLLQWQTLFSRLSSETGCFFLVRLYHISILLVTRFRFLYTILGVPKMAF